MDDENYRVHAYLYIRDNKFGKYNLMCLPHSSHTTDLEP